MKYLVAFIASVITILFTVATINWFVDPYGMYWSPSIEQVNKKKIKANNRVRLTKLYRPSQINPEILIIGNSRAEMGLNPAHALFDENRVYNQAMPGTSVVTQVNYALKVIDEEPQLKKILMSLDVVDFFKRKNSAPSIIMVSRKRSSIVNNIKDFVPLLFSLETFIDSLSTIAFQQRITNSITPLGFNTAETFSSVVKHEGIIELYKQKYQQIAKNLDRDFYVEMDEKKSSQLIALKALLTATQSNNIEVVFFISPYHYSYLHTLNDTGHWPLFLAWKQKMSDFISAQDHVISLWDFSGFNQFTTEVVPINEIHQEMKWYWEPSHYKKELGNEILNTMLSNQKSEPQFGLILNSHSIKTKLKNDTLGLNTTKHQWEKLKNTLQ